MSRDLNTGFWLVTAWHESDHHMILIQRCWITGVTVILNVSPLNIILSGVTRTSVSEMNNNFSQTGSQTNFEVSRVSQISEWLRTPEPGLSHPFYRPGPWPPAALVSLWKFPVSLRKWPSEFAKLTANLWSNFWGQWRMICWSPAASSWRGPARPSAGQGAPGQVCPQRPVTTSSRKPHPWSEYKCKRVHGFSGSDYNPNAS